MTDDTPPPIELRPFRLDDAPVLAELSRESATFHRPWTSLPSTATAWVNLLDGTDPDRTVRRLVVVEGRPAGAVNLSDIIRGVFQNAFMGYWVFSWAAGRGIMRRAVAQVLDEAFTTLQLHRVEANIQPANEASRRLVHSLGMRLEGVSPGYLFIGSGWQDHERWAITSEEWQVAGG